MELSTNGILSDFQRYFAKIRPEIKFKLLLACLLLADEQRGNATADGHKRRGNAIGGVAHRLLVERQRI